MTMEAITSVQEPTFNHNSLLIVFDSPQPHGMLKDLSMFLLRPKNYININNEIIKMMTVVVMIMSSLVMKINNNLAILFRVFGMWDMLREPKKNHAVNDPSPLILTE